MRSRLFAVASAVSLLLFVATVLLWVRSYWVADRVTRKYAQKISVGDPDDPATPTQIKVFTLTTNRGIVEAYWQRSAFPALFRENLPDWKQDYPEGAFFVWEQNVAFHGGLLINVVNRKVLFDHAGLSVETHSVTGVSSFTNFYVTMITVPAWFFGTITAILPAVWIANRLRQKHRTSELRCHVCSYDLTGNTSGTCPECGTPVPPSPGPA